MKRCWNLLLLLLLFGSVLPAAAEVETVFGRVEDARSGLPVAAAQIWSDGEQTSSDASGHFTLTSESGSLIVRAPGYLPKKVRASAPADFKLVPILPRALYLSFWAADSDSLRSNLLRLLQVNGLNALVIDIKSARGHLAYRSAIPLAREIGAQRVRPLKDLPELLAELKARGIYTIARMVVFKDDLLARNRPGMAVKSADNSLWQDREKLAWSDPFNRAVWEYNIAVAEEAARFGFDEIQFDYIRFPSRSDLLFSRPTSDETRVAAIDGFLDRARQQLAPFPVMLSANLFGYTCWKPEDGKIGQRLVDLAQRVDYLSPMLYPSGFDRGIPGFPNPVANSSQVISRSLQEAQRLAGIPARQLRPWLQAFRDYAFDRRSFGAAEVHAQINASVASGSQGWMLWNAASRYSQAGLQQILGVGDLKLTDVSPARAELFSRTEPESNGVPPL